MGKVINEKHILVGGVQTETRENELIIIHDITDDEGYGVYIDSPGDGNTSFTTSFGGGPLAQHLSTAFFQAVGNYYEDYFKEYTTPVSLSEFDFTNEEFKDTWMKITTFSDLMEENFGSIDKENTYYDGLADLLQFIVKWGLKEIPVKN